LIVVKLQSGKLAHKKLDMLAQQKNGKEVAQQRQRHRVGSFAPKKYRK